MGSKEDEKRAAEFFRNVAEVERTRPLGVGEERFYVEPEDSVYSGPAESA